MNDNMEPLKITTKERLNKIIDTILTLRGLGLEPTGFSMDADMLWSLSYLDPTEHLDSWGGFDLKGITEKYDFSIMGIPIEPDFHGRVIKARRKEDEREITTNSKSV